MYDEVDQKRIKDAVHEADDAFWAVIAKAFPECKTGDFDPMATFKFTAAQEYAVTTWLEANRPVKE